MKNKIVNLCIYSVLISLFFACVPAKKFEDMKSKWMNCDADMTSFKKQNDQLKTDITELTNTKDELIKKTKALEKDTSVLGLSLRKMMAQYDKIDKLNNEINDKLEKQKTGNMEEQGKLLKDLQYTKEDLIKKEAELKKLEKVLNDREMNLNNLTQQLKSNQSELDQKQKKLDELQSVLSRKDSIVKALKTKVSDALMGFENKGLTVEQKNGKVYVSMEEALLFPSASFSVNKRGAEALKKLSVVLELNPDINVLVEGHTDAVAYKGSGQLKDNWDLSVMRATTIVKTILQGSKIDPARLTAAGRGEYFPVASNENADGRAKNRRTEVILTPKLDELFKILETN